MRKIIYTVSDIQSKLQPVFKKYNIKKAILFGSYAKGLADSNSDIDIVVDSNLRGLAFYGFLEDVVTSVDKSVDLLDMSQITPASPIQNEINSTGVVIYG